MKDVPNHIISTRKLDLHQSGYYLGLGQSYRLDYLEDGGTTDNKNKES